MPQFALPLSEAEPFKQYPEVSEPGFHSHLTVSYGDGGVTFSKVCKAELRLNQISFVMLRYRHLEIEQSRLGRCMPYLCEVSHLWDVFLSHLCICRAVLFFSGAYRSYALEGDLLWQPSEWGGGLWSLAGRWQSHVLTLWWAVPSAL